MTNPYEDISDEIATRTIRVESVKNFRLKILCCGDVLQCQYLF